MTDKTPQMPDEVWIDGMNLIQGGEPYRHGTAYNVKSGTSTRYVRSDLAPSTTDRGLDAEALYQSCMARHHKVIKQPEDYDGSISDVIRMTISDVLFKLEKQRIASPPCVDGQPSTGADTVCVVEGFVGFYADEVNVHFVGYNSAQKLMRVEFKNGHQFNYQDVPKEIFDGMATSERRGKFLHEKVKGYYRYYRVNGD